MRKLRWALLSALLVMGVASTVQSMPQGAVYIEFYSDDTYSEIVGYTYRGCSGYSSDGIQTPYRRHEQWSCSSIDFYECNYMFCHYDPILGREDCFIDGPCA